VIDPATGDLNRDGVTDISDLSILLTFFDRTVPVADFDDDLLVGLTDSPSCSGHSSTRAGPTMRITPIRRPTAVTVSTS
jgi:hypothetical protein